MWYCFQGYLSLDNVTESLYCNNGSCAPPPGINAGGPELYIDLDITGTWTLDSPSLIH